MVSDQLNESQKRTRPLSRVLKQLILVLSTGYVFVYYSELLFWARVRPGDSWGNWFSTWMAFSLVAYVFLLLVSHFKIHQIWPLFLAGAVVGWLTEGVIVETTYESLPLSISFTGLAWHALITVWVGWYLVQKLMHSASLRKMVWVSALMGSMAGLWAITWWVEPPPDGGISTMSGYAMFMGIAIGFLLLAYRLAAWAGRVAFTPPRWVSGVIFGLFTAYFLLVRVPANPIALGILPVLLGLMIWGMHHSKQPSDLNYLQRFSTSPDLKNQAAFLLLPAMAILVYGLADSLNVRWHTNWVFYLLTTPAGFFLAGYGLWRSLKSSPTNLDEKPED